MSEAVDKLGSRSPHDAPAIRVRDVVLRDSEDFERFYTFATGMQPAFVQLSPGELIWRARTVDLGGVVLVWVRSDGCQQWRDQMPPGGLHFGFAVASAGPITARGREIGSDEARVWIAGQTMDLVMAGPLVSVEIGVEASLVDELGWRFAGEPTRRVSYEALIRLTNSCRSAVLEASALSASHGALAPAVAAASWRDRILDDLERVLHPWLADEAEENARIFRGTRPFQLLKQVEDMIDSLDGDRAIEVDRLAHQLGVPRRTLFHAFRSAVGMGPRRYFEIKRLHALRLQLRHAEDPGLTVTAVATALGFSDLSRLPRVYRAYFGENPSATLKEALARAG